MEKMKKALIVVAKWPKAGMVKTRLCPPLSHEQAARLYRCFLLDSFDLYKQLEDVDVIVSYFPPETRDIFKSSTPKNFILLEQSGADLGEKFIHAFEYCLNRGYDLVSIIGSDHPSLPVAFVRESYNLLEKPETDMVIGPTVDGGYYMLGLKALHRRVFQDINWSTNTVFTETLERADEEKLNVARLPDWYDVDDGDGLRLLYNDLKELRNRESVRPERTVRFLTEHDIKALLSS